MPVQVVFKGLCELEQLEDDGSVELLHLNCSNRVLVSLGSVSAGPDFSHQPLLCTARLVSPCRRSTCPT